MFADDIRRALPGTPRERLAELSAAVWKGFACGAVSEEDAQQLAEEIAARKIVPPKPAAPRKPVGSRPRSPAHMERRRRWTGSGWLPPQLAARFTMAETAVLSTIAAEVARRGLCRLTIGHIAALAGRRALDREERRPARPRRSGILTSEEWRLTAWRIGAEHGPHRLAGVARLAADAGPEAGRGSPAAGGAGHRPSGPRGWGQNSDHPSEYQDSYTDQHSTTRTRLG